MATPMLFFGDGSLSIHPAYQRLLQARKEDSLLSIFLSRARQALQHEISKIPIPDRKGMPDLAELEILIQEVGDRTPENQCLAPAMLVITQLGQFISWYEARPEEPYPDSTSAIIVGLCVGQLSAVAVSQAKSLVELLPLAVESVRIALRTGVLATTIRDELERSSDINASWAMTVSGELGQDALDKIHQQNKTLERKRAYISADFRKALTLQGPPSTLDSIESWIGSKSPKSYRQRLPIYTPYHAPHLYSAQDIQQILDFSGSENVVYHNNPWTSPKPRLVSPVTGKYYTSANRSEMIQSVLNDVLREPIQWGSVAAGCAEYVGVSESSSWVVRPFGPTLAAGSLVSTLKKFGKVEAVLDDFFSASDNSQRGTVTQEPIAIVGMAGRFPDAISHDELWKLLEAGTDCHKVIPIDRFDADVYLSKDGQARNPIGTPYGCFIKQPGLFDARLFNMSPREAEQTDPQQRLILTTAYEALEMSGFVANRTPSTQLGRIGTYYGQTTDDYREMNSVQDVSTYFISGGVRAFGPGRINHHFKFGGPSMSIDTACSSSAVALNVACTALWANDCDTALVGGMTLFTSPDGFCGLHRGHFLNTTGSCKTFDDKADGYCRGEAVATVVVKRLCDAKADNDNILAVILATGTNYSAASASITHPHGPTQEVLYRRLLNQAGLNPFDVDFIEMHGTGTQAGDAAEMSSVSNVFAPASPTRPIENPLWLSSVKANVGHGESASGVTALIKTLLVLREEKIPPHVGIKSGVMNHTFPDFDERRIKIAVNGAGSLPRTEKRTRRALVNNFGAAGGNTALLLEESPRKIASGVVDIRKDHIINITAKTITSIKNNIKNLISFLGDSPKVSLSDLSYTTTARRSQLPMKISVVASSVTDLKEKLTVALASESYKPAVKVSSTIFAFTGQGSLYLPLANELFVSCKQFQSDIIRFNQICLDHGFTSFISAVDGSATDIETLSPSQSQLAITAVQMALYRLWESWGVTPTAVIGHSLGEYAALFACGVLSTNDTLYLVGRRAAILEATCTQKTHCMISIHATIDIIKNTLGRKFAQLEVACINGPEDTVLSGPSGRIEEAQEQIKSAGLKCTILNTPYAFHSAQVDPILEEFETAARGAKYMKPRIPLLSPLLGTIVKESGVVGPAYLRKHAREAVDFKTALELAEKEGLAGRETVWIELGPTPVCLGMVRSTLGSQTRAMPALRKNENAWSTVAKSLSFLSKAGVDINWNEYHRDFESCQSLLDIPTYSFDEKNYWIEYKNNWALRRGDVVPVASTIIQPEPAMTTTVQRLVSKSVDANKATVVFETDLSDPAMHAIIAGHNLNGLALCPAGVYADMALTVGDYIRREFDFKVVRTGINVTNMEILASVTVPMPRVASPQLLHITSVADLDSGVVDVTFGTYSSKTKKTSSTAKCIIEYGNDKAWLHEWSRSAYLIQKRIQDLERGVQEGTTDKITKKMAYQLFSALVVYGAKYQGMQDILVNGDELEATCTLNLYQGADIGRFFASPLWLDNLAQLSGFVMNAIGVLDPRIAVYISHGWGSLQLGAPLDPTKPYRVHVKMQEQETSIVAGNVSIFQGETMVGFLGDIRFQRVPRAVLDTMLPSPTAVAPAKPKQIAAPPAPRASAPKQAAPVVVPRNAAPVKASPMTKILELIAEEIGVAISELTDDSDFSELGVDSLLSLTILSKIREAIGLDLAPSTFQDCQTVGELRQSLGDSSSSASSASDEDFDIISETSVESDIPADVAPKPSGGEANSMVDTLHSTIAEQIGIDVEELLIIDDLSSLGVDSLMSLTIVAALRENLGIDIPSDIFQTNTSLKGMKKALNFEEAPSAPVKAVKTSASTASKKCVANSMLLQGNPKTATRTVFLFPDGSGSATSYAALPEIAPQTCVFAINSPYLKHPDQYTCSLEEVSQMMTNELLKRQPQGPYFLAGWSAGGMYAYEAALQLTSAGQTIEKLILIDSPCRLDYGPMPKDVLEYVSKSGVISGGVRGGDSAPQWLVDHFDGTLKAVKTYAPVAFAPGKAPETFVIWASKGVFEDWPKAELAGLDLNDEVAAWLMKPKNNPGSLGWEKLLSRERITCTNVDGNHFSMVHPPNCDSLSHAIADALKDSSAERAGKWRAA